MRQNTSSARSSALPASNSRTLPKGMPTSHRELSWRPLTGPIRFHYTVWYRKLKKGDRHVRSTCGQVGGGDRGVQGHRSGIAGGLAEAGTSVNVNYAGDRSGADRVVAEITRKGGKAVAVQGDVSKAAAMKRLFAEAVRAFNRLDVVVNNAGVYRFGPFESITEEE